MSGGLAEIRGWLLKGESAEGWLGMCRVLEGLEASEREMLVGYVSQHTKGWREAIRRPLYEWWERKKRGEWTGYEGLVVDWSMYGWSEGRVAGEERVVPYLEGMRVRWIPAGRFQMGAGADDTEAKDNERPQHDVTITRGFWMMATPVLRGQYRAVMGHDPSSFQGLDLDPLAFQDLGYDSSTFQNLGLHVPVDSVSWYDAAAFADKLSALEGLSACFAGEGAGADGLGNGGRDYVRREGWRLPTEAEREYACRAGTTTPRYGDVDKIAWRSNNIMTTTHSSGEKEANAYGLRDMLGNVWEWCYDLYGGYSAQGAVDPVGAAVGFYRVIRGSSWLCDAKDVRATWRSGYRPTGSSFDRGFRLVKSSV